MVDALSSIWAALTDIGIASWVIIIILVLLLCGWLLIKEYGRAFLAHLLHRRNIISLCGIMIFFVIFLVLFQTEIFFKIHYVLRSLLLLIYAFYLATVLLSVKGPVLFSRRYLKKYQKYLKNDLALEHRELISKMPWYFLDANEKIGYQILKGKYLFNQGNVRGAYSVMSAIDQKLLYPEEVSDLTIDMVFVLQQLGNLTKANEIVENIKLTDTAAYGFLKSYLFELHGDFDAAWQCAHTAENAINSQKKDARIWAALYTQMGRLSFFRNNITEMFRYYHLALEQAKKYKDVRLLHPAYQNLLNQIQMQNLYIDEQDRLLSEYSANIAASSLKSLVEIENYHILLARQKGDRDAEYATIMDGYHSLHKMTTPPEQCMIEVSTLKMLANGEYDASEVLNDIAKHFDSYFSLPLPARFIVLQELTCPKVLTQEQVAFYEQWTPRLVDYAQNKAMIDLNQYECSLSSDCVNERCWVILQRIDFTRRGNADYDGQQVLRWFQEIAQIQHDHGQLFKELETEILIVKQYDEMIGMQQVTPNAETLDHMRNILAVAHAKSEQLPSLTVGSLLIELAHFSTKLGEPAQALESLNRFRNLNLSSAHFSLELQQKIAALEEFFPKV